MPLLHSAKTSKHNPYMYFFRDKQIKYWCKTDTLDRQAALNKNHNNEHKLSTDTVLKIPNKTLLFSN